jgi:hypothetical protein
MLTLVCNFVVCCLHAMSGVCYLSYIMTTDTVLAWLLFFKNLSHYSFLRIEHPSAVVERKYVLEYAWVT